MPTKAELEAQLEQLKAAPASATPKSRTVKLPSMLKLKDAGVAVGVDPTYTNNIAVFALKSDGEIATKGDGTIKKPKRVSRKAMLAMLEHSDEVRKLCEFDAS